jgi:LmbE family N-acetylglucosaminyl deacetylase
MKILVVAPHPDDETLGAGGTIARLSDEGNEVAVAIVTKGWEPLFPNSQVVQVRSEAQDANKILGVKSLIFLDLPVTKLDEIPRNELNRTFEELIKNELPEIVFLPFWGDLHKDHKVVFESCMAALRPAISSRFLKRILCYETVSETHQSTPNAKSSFEPQVWIEIEKYLPIKLEAMRTYKSQLQDSPGARSIEAVSSLAKWRGSMVGMAASESFVIVRECLRAN